VVKVPSETIAIPAIVAPVLSKDHSDIARVFVDERRKTLKEAFDNILDTK
jgi:hypothetical protein